MAKNDETQHVALGQIVRTKLFNPITNLAHAISQRMQTIRFRLSISFALLVLLPLAITNVVVFETGLRTGRQQAKEKLELVAALKATEINAWVNRLQTGLTSVLTEDYALLPARSYLILRANDLSGILAGAKAELDQALEAYIRRTQLFTVLFLMDTEGEVVTSAGATLQGRQYGDQAFFQQGLQSIYLLPPSSYDFADELMVLACHPVLDTDGRPLGVLCGSASLEAINQLALDRAGLGNSGEIYLVGRVAGESISLTDLRTGESGTRIATPGVKAALENHQAGFQLYANYANSPVAGAYRWLPGLQVALLVEQGQAEIFAATYHTLAINIAVAFALALLAVLVSLLITRSIARPLATLTETAIQVAAGDFTLTAPVTGHDEIGAVARAFNSMTTQLRELIGGLEQRVVERAGEIEERSRYLEASAQVSQAATSILETDQLIREVVNLIRDHFGLYHVGLFFLDESAHWAEYRAGTGKAGQTLVEQEFRLEVGGFTMIGMCTANAHAYVAANVSEEDAQNDYPLLPKTRSEAALPLIARGQVIGALNVLSDRPGSFNQDTVVVLQTMADQVAIALQNTRLYEAEQARRRVAETLREVGHILASTLNLNEVLDRLLEQLDLVVPYNRAAVILQSGDVMRMAAVRGYENPNQAMEMSIDIRENDVFSQVSQSRQVLVIPNVASSPGWKQVDWLPLDHSWLGAPLIVHDQVIGMLSLTRSEKSAFDQEEGLVVFTFANQAAIAIHNARLYEQVRDFNLQLERKVQERTAELEQAYKLLEQLDSNKSDFINIAAHELRTPLTVMKGYTAMMQADQAIQQSPYLGEAVNGVLKGTDRLYEIVNSMLDVARIDSQVLDLSPKPTELIALIERVRNEFASDLVERDLTLEVSGVDELPPIKVDPSMLYKVFYGVIINAIKYTPDGGRITVSGRHLPSELGDCIEVIVCDTGIGIDPEHHDLIFEKFYQTGRVALHSSGRTKFKGGGPGLGLAIARGIVQAHKGRIWVESERHDEEACPGSCFHILLPMSGVPERAKIVP